MKLKAALILAACIASAGAAGAQVPRVPDEESVRVRFGPLLMNPSLSLTNAGVDDNVFNESESEGPQRDFTLTVTPAADLWLRLGRTWLAGNFVEDLVWYKDYASERSANNQYSIGWIVPLNRLSFHVGGSWLNARERPGFEIDLRSDRKERGINAGLELRALAKTHFGFRGNRRQVEFDRDELFGGSSLAGELNRTVTIGELTVRHELTPLTTITFSGGLEYERFESSPLRDSDSTRFAATVRFDPFALISGSAQVGYRNFKPLSSTLPEYSGTTAVVDLAYVAAGSTRLGVRVNRDVQYSFEINQPYYLQTGILGTLTQQVYGPLDAEGRIGRQRFAYEARRDVTVPVPDRVDAIRSYGAGVGYRLGPDLRVAVNVDQQKRTSAVELRQYDGLRYGVSMTYGVR